MKGQDKSKNKKLTEHQFQTAKKSISTLNLRQNPLDFNTANNQFKLLTSDK